MPVHPFPPVWNERCRVLVLGSFPSVKSRETGFYYGHPRNRFWPMAAAVFGEETPPDIPGKKSLLLRHGIALWDAAASCEIAGSMDRDMKRIVPTDLTEILRTAPIGRVLANGRQAGEIYERYQFPKTGVPFTVLPSTSPANAAWTLDRLCAAWAPWLRRTAHA